MYRLLGVLLLAACSTHPIEDCINAGGEWQLVRVVPQYQCVDKKTGKVTIMMDRPCDYKQVKSCVMPKEAKARRDNAKLKESTLGCILSESC